VQIFDMHTLAVASQVPADPNATCRHVAAFADRNRLLVAAQKSTEIRQIDLNEDAKTLTWQAAGPMQVDALFVARNGSHSLSGCLGRFELWSHEDATARQLFELQRTPAGAKLNQRAAALNSDGSVLLVAERPGNNRVDSALLLVDGATGAFRHTYPGHSGELCAADFTPDDQYAVSADRAGTVKIWAIPPATDRDRSAAEWALRKGGELTIEWKRNGRTEQIAAGGNLPEQPFYVRKILLGGNKAVSDDEMQHVSGLVRLSTLNLCDTSITDAGLAAMVGLPSLTRLELAGVRMTDAANETLVHCRSLAHLELSRTGNTNDGVAALLSLPTLRHLSLNETAIDDGAMPLLRRLDDLATLYVARTRITDKGVLNLKALRHLGYLDCTGTKVTAEALNSLRNDLPGLQIKSDTAP
jgi:hypothetical protein